MRQCARGWLNEKKNVKEGHVLCDGGGDEGFTLKNKIQKYVTTQYYSIRQRTRPTSKRHQNDIRTHMNDIRTPSKRHPDWYNQRTTTQYYALQRPTMCYDALLCTPTYDNLLQRTTTCYSALQCTAKVLHRHQNDIKATSEHIRTTKRFQKIIQHTAMYYNVLLCTTT